MGRIGANIGGTLDRRRFALLFVIGSTLVVAASAAADGTSVSVLADAAVPTDQILVRLAAGASLDASALGATAGVKLKHVRRLGRHIRPQAAEASQRTGSCAITERLAARGDVLSAGPDALMQPLSVPTDPSWSEEWDMFAPSSGSYGIDLPGAL